MARRCPAERLRKRLKKRSLYRNQRPGPAGRGPSLDQLRAQPTELPAPIAQAVAEVNMFERNITFDTILVDPAGSFRREPQKRLDRAGGLLTGA